ncbi:MAG: hypothetical protein LBK68_00265 [Candidatus Margulisbacteria bacterium]|jgi:hypothetical protein|nr:hypothetical protein [Candidatus Margulisiibacteriota bacterium]
MPETNKVLLEPNNEHAINIEDSASAFLSSIDENLDDPFGKDLTSIQSKPLAGPKLAGQKKTGRKKNKDIDQTFWTKFTARLFTSRKNKISAALDTANISGRGKDGRDKFVPAEKKTDSGYIRNFKQYDPPEEIAQEKDSYYTVKHTADGAVVDGAYGYSAKTDSYNSVTDYIDPLSPQIADFLKSIPELNDTVLSTEEKLVKLYNYIVENFAYAAESADSWSSVGETIAKHSGDCEDLATLLASALIALLKREGLSYKEAQDRVFAVAGSSPQYDDHVFVEYTADDGQKYIFDPALRGQTIAALTDLPRARADDPNFIVYFRFNDNKVIGETLADVDSTVTFFAFNSLAGSRPVALINASSQTVTLPNTLTLSGSTSYDTDGQIVSYAWSEVTNKGATIVNTTRASTEIRNLNVGVYMFRLIVTDNDGNTNYRDISITVEAAVAPPPPPPPPPNQAPTVEIQSSATSINLPNNTITLNSTGSRDADGQIVSYAWSEVTSKGATIVNPTGASTEIRNLNVGTYIFRLTVTDDRGATSYRDITITVNPEPVPPPPPPNQAPTVEIQSSATTINLPDNTVTLNSTGSRDTDGQIVSYAWSEVTNKGATIVSPTGTSTEIRNLNVGTYIFRLTVTDDRGATSYRDITITVNPEPVPPPPPPNQAPTVEIQSSATTIYLPDDTITLNSTGSRDADGQIVSYAWSEVTNKGATIVSPTGTSTEIRNLNAGTYVFRLTVTDDKGAVNYKDITITVETIVPNVYPVAEINAPVSIQLPRNSLILNGAASYDRDGSIASYAWSEVTNKGATIVNATGVSTEIKDLQAGFYMFRLTVTDDKGAISYKDVMVEVIPAGRPTANAGNDQTIRLPENWITLHGSGQDPDGEIVAYFWEQLNGPAGTTINGANTANPLITGLKEGTYIFQLTVTDNDGKTHKDTVTITVLEAPPPLLHPELLTDTHQTIDPSIIGIIINQTITNDILAMSDDKNFFLGFDAYAMSNLATDYLCLTGDQMAELSRLLNEGDKAKINNYLNKTVLPYLTTEEQKYAQLSYYSTKADKRYHDLQFAKQTIQNVLLPMSIQEFKRSNYVSKIHTDFIQVDTYKFNQLRERILLGAYLQKLLTMITQAKGDSRNAIQEILTQQSGYQKMNIEKLNDKQTAYLTNYINTRTKEINEYAKNYNEKAEAELKEAQRQQQEYAHTNLLVSLVMGIITILAGVIAAIFSAGVAAPLVISAFATVVDVVQTIRKTDQDIELKKEQEKLEEQLAMLRTSEKRMEDDYLRGKKTELERLRNEALASGNQEYAKMLEMEIAQLTAALDASALEHQDGFLEFDNAQYTENSLRVNMLAMLLRLLASVQKAQHEGRNIVASELSLPAATVSNYGGEIVNKDVMALLETVSKKGSLELQTVQAYNKAALTRQEIKEAKTGLAEYVIGKVFFTLIDVVTFGAGGGVAQNVLRGLGESVYNFTGKAKKAARAKYDPNRAAIFAAEPQATPTSFAEMYADVLSGSSQLMRDLTENKKALDYERYLQVITDLQRLQRLENIEIALNAAAKNSRNVIHQELTDKKTRTQDTLAKVATQQSFSLLQDVVQKQKQLTEIQIQAINQKVDQRTELLNAGFNILASVFAGWLGGLSSVASDNNNLDDAFIYGLTRSIWDQNKNNIFDLAIGDSDLKLRAEDQGASYGGAQGGLSDFGSDDLWQEDARGNVTVDQTVLLKKYAKLQRALLLDQALITLQSAKQKSRDVVHMELAEKSAAGVGLAQTLTDINRESLLTKWTILVDKAYARAEQLSKKNTRTTDLQRDFLTTLVSASVSSLGYAGGWNNEQALALGSLTTLSMKTFYTLSNIYDTTLDAANRLTAENLTEGDLAEELGLNRLTAAEKELLLQAMEYKNVSGEYGFQLEDRGRLEYIHALLDQLQKTQDLLLQMKAELDSGRGNVHSVLETGAAELESILKDYQNLHKQFIQQLMQSLKKGAGEIAQRENSRQQQLLDLQLEAFDSALQALQSITPFLDSKTEQQVLSNLTQNLQPLSSLYRVLTLHFRRGEKGAAEPMDLSALNPAERLRVESAYAGADLELTEIARNSGLYDQMLKMIDRTAQQIAQIAAKKITEKTLSDKLDALLNDNRLAALREELSANTEKQREMCEQIEALRAAVPAGHELYATHLQPAWELYQAGDYSGALAKFTGLNEERLGSEVLAGRECVQELQTLTARAAQLEQELAQAEYAAQTQTQTLREALDYLQKHGEEFAETQKLFEETARSLGEHKDEIQNIFADDNYYHWNIYRFMQLDDTAAQEALQKVSPAAAEKLTALRRSGQDYQLVCRSVSALAPLFQDRQRYTELLTALAQSAPQYSGEVAQLHSGLVSAQGMYAQFAGIEQRGEKYVLGLDLPMGPQQTQETLVAQIALFAKFDLPVPKNLAEIEEIYQETQNVRQNYQPYTPGTDVAKLWEGFFVERSRSRKAQEKAQAGLDAARTAWEQADKDYEVMFNLFNANPEQEVNIAGLAISQELKLYLNGVTGGAGIPLTLRPRILEYLDRRRDNREIELLNNEADTEFAANILAADWQEIKKLQEIYDEAMQKYLQSGDEAALENLNEKRAELERKERAFRQKRERFLVQQKRGVIN